MQASAGGGADVVEAPPVEDAAVVVAMKAATGVVKVSAAKVVKVGLGDSEGAVKVGEEVLGKGRA